MRNKHGQDGQTDRRVDQLLAGLRAVEPDVGMERRLLAAVRQRGAEATAPRRREVARFRVPQWAWAAPATALVLSCLLWVQHGRDVGRHTARPSAPAVQANAAAVTEAIRTPEVGGVALSEFRAGLSERPESAELPLVHSRRVRPTEPRRGAADAATVTLGNHPAPEAPLTDEERLLLRIANRHQPEDVAVLNPDARDAQARADSAEFRQFFGPPSTGDRE